MAAQPQEPPELLEFLAPYSPEIQALARHLRRRLLEILPPCIEIVWDATNTVGSSFGFTEKNRDHFIHLPAYSTYVNLGFNFGTSLHDPERRLKGTGARIRHLRIDKPEDLEDPYILDLIQQAHLGARHSGEAVEAKTLIRVMEGPKRRPRPKG